MVTPRERARERTLAEIRDLAWTHLEAEGAAALSLRAIARDLGVVSSAIYRYVPSRDDLLTELIIEGYQDLADVTARADAEVTSAGAGPRGRWLAIARAMRGWALARPAAWALLYGSPVPGYDAPAERTTPVGTLTMVQMVGVVADAVTANTALTPTIPPGDLAGVVPEALLAAAASIGAPIEEPALIASTILGWSGVVAHVSSEVFEQLGPNLFGDAEAWAEVAFGASADLVGLPRE